MKNYPLLAFLFIVTIVFSFVAELLIPKQSQVIQTPVLYGSVSTQKALALKDIYKLCQRLKGDNCMQNSLDYGTSQEISQAVVDASNDLGVTIPNGANQNAIDALVRNKLGEQSRLCNNPESVSVDPKKTKDSQTANP